jgi:glycosyltransferase involved in cell wall biosynthesis/GT2 family glycosyltransferase
MESAAVLIRCRDSAPYIRRTLGTVLSQPGVDADVLIIDDASGDGTVDEIRSIRDSRVTLVECRSFTGTARCLNHLLEIADSSYVITVPDDAFLVSDALLRMIEALERSPRVGIAYTGSFALDPDGRVTRDRVRRRAQIHSRWAARHSRLDYLLAFGEETLGPIAYRRRALDEIGRFDETLDGDAGLAAVFRIAERYEVQEAGLICARGRGTSRRPSSLRARLAVYRRSRLSGNRRSKSALAAGLGAGGAIVLEEARRRGATAREAIRTFLIWSILVPLRDRLYQYALSRWANWPLGVGRRRRQRRPPDRIAYYLWRYPVLSQTFIARELIALEEAGVDVRVIADGADYGPPAGAGHLPQVRRTEYLDPIRPGQLLRDLAAAALRRPLRTTNLFIYVIAHTYQQPKSLRGDAQLFLRAVRLASVLRSHRVDHLHSPWGNASAFIALIAARLAGIEFSVQFRAHDIHRRTAAFLLPEKIRHARFVVTNSRFNQAHLRALVPETDHAKIHQIYNGLDLARLEVVRARSSQGTPPTILSVARLIEAKGLPYLFEACRMLHESGYRFRCEIVGAPELPLYVNDYIEIMSLHRRLGIGDYVELLGPMPFSRVLERYAQADLFVLPCVVAKDGSNDITPNSLLEAMAMRLPVVSTTITAIGELVTDGVSGLLVPSKDPVALREAIARVIDDPDLRRRLGENARKRVEERFDIHTNVRAYASLFRAS